MSDRPRVHSRVGEVIVGKWRTARRVGKKALHGFFAATGSCAGFCFENRGSGQRTTSFRLPVVWT